MPNAIYPLYKRSLLLGDTNADLDLDTTQDGVYAALVDVTPGGYTYSDAHQFYSSIAANVVGTPQRITTPTISTLAAFDGTDVTYTAVTGNTAEAIVLYRQNAGANTTWRLIAFIDTGVTGLPVTPNGGNITVTWNASGIFQL
jgi:hypothetical protein